MAAFLVSIQGEYRTIQSLYVGNFPKKKAAPKDRL